MDYAYKDFLHFEGVLNEFVISKIIIDLVEIMQMLEAQAKWMKIDLDLERIYLQNDGKFKVMLDFFSDSNENYFKKLANLILKCIFGNFFK